MSAITPRFSLKLRGLTSADAVLGTVSITLGGDGILRFTDAGGVRRQYALTEDIAILMRECLTGTGGLTATDRVSNKPILTINGQGGRTDS